METNYYCFVIQPFDDGGKFDKRFFDIYEPAIKAAGLNAYRIDKDSSVRKVVDDIENKIRNSQICFADISTDNPNVWYELGYAYASGKEVVMVCDNSRNKFPFDIQHRSIIPYKTESSSDFTELLGRITEKIKSYLSTKKTSEVIRRTPLKETDGFQPLEMALMALLIEGQIIDEQSVPVYLLTEQMEGAGYNKIATSIGMRLLKQKGMLDTFYDQDWGGQEYPACKLMEKGVDFVLHNVDKFNLKRPPIAPPSVSAKQDEDLPF